MLIIIKQAEELAAALAASKGQPAQTDNDAVSIILLIYFIDYCYFLAWFVELKLTWPIICDWVYSVLWFYFLD